jgi:hypothetical protein
METANLIMLVVIICLALMLCVVFVCLEVEYRQTLREKRDALRKKRRTTEVSRTEHGYGRRAA